MFIFNSISVKNKVLIYHYIIKITRNFRFKMLEHSSCILSAFVILIDLERRKFKEQIIFII